MAIERRRGLGIVRRSGRLSIDARRCGAGVRCTPGANGRPWQSVGEESARGLALGFAQAELVGGGHGLGGGCCCKPNKCAARRGVGSMREMGLAPGFDAYERPERCGDPGRIEPGFELAQCYVVDVAEVQGSEVRVEIVAKERRWVEGVGHRAVGRGGRHTGIGVRTRRRVARGCPMWSVESGVGLEHGCASILGAVVRGRAHRWG